MDRTVKSASALRGELTLPPDKSISQRAAIFSLLHEGSSTVQNYSKAEDPQSTLRAIEELGAEVNRKNGTVVITGKGRDFLKNLRDAELECNNSGTCMRLLSGVVAGAGVSAKLTGDPSLSSRSMTRIIKPLEQMGANILARDEAYAPLYITRFGDFSAIEYELPIPSAQVKSCVLLAGLFGNEETRVVETTPSRDHTERLLQLPISYKNGKRMISSHAGLEIPNQSYMIPADFSSAAFWLVAGSILPNSEIVLTNIGLNPTRTALMTILQDMGANIESKVSRKAELEPFGDIVIKSADLKGIEIPAELIPNCIDELPILSVAMSFAEGTSVIRGAGELRHKETDRIMAIAHILKAAGVKFEELEDGLIIDGNPDHSFKSAAFKSFHDHRIAMASAIMSLKGEKSSTIADPECAAVSYPTFWSHLDTLSI